ncbi:hypothetical protein FOA52_002739 [Chlamydomonas sp. UWO 241]|nr:hypothetical protein FOA52_002739 [Chlamydomonas sp. UWO 241]
MTADAFGSGAALCWWAKTGSGSGDGDACTAVRLNGRTGALWDDGGGGVAGAGVSSADGGGGGGAGAIGGGSRAGGGGGGGSTDDVSSSRVDGDKRGVAAGADDGGGAGGGAGGDVRGSSGNGGGSTGGVSSSRAGGGGAGVPPALRSPVCKAALLQVYAELCDLREACPAYDDARAELLSSPLHFAPAEGTVGHPEGAKRRVGTGYARKE